MSDLSLKRKEAQHVCGQQDYHVRCGTSSSARCKHKAPHIIAKYTEASPMFAPASRTEVASCGSGTRAKTPRKKMSARTMPSDVPGRTWRPKRHGGNLQGIWSRPTSAGSKIPHPINLRTRLNVGHGYTRRKEALTSWKQPWIHAIVRRPCCHREEGILGK